MVERRKSKNTQHPVTPEKALRALVTDSNRLPDVTLETPGPLIWMWLYQRLSPHSSRTPTALQLLHCGKMDFVKIGRFMTGLILFYLGTMSLSTLCNSCSLKHGVNFIVTFTTLLNKRSKLVYLQSARQLCTLQYWNSYHVD
jgi:hypothetical protein